MPKNVFFMSFLYVFIACAMFLAVSVHSQPSGDPAAYVAAAESYTTADYSHLLHRACAPWSRR